MAFASSSIAAVGKYTARMTGQLAGGAAGTVALSGADVTLPSTHPGIDDYTVVVFNTTAVGGGLGGVSAVKSAGTLTLTNLDGGNTVNFEIYIISLHSIMR